MNEDGNGGEIKLEVGDKGYIEATNGNITYILDTKKENNL